MENIARPLTVALGERDKGTRLHSDRVVQLAAELGNHIELSTDELEVLAMGAQFHDIGKIGIPDNVLSKPAAFEASEWAVMKQHPLIGERIVLAIGADHSAEIAQAVRHHHENFDGSGYPDGLAGTDIPLASRIISLADNYDAMAVTRPYHKARSHEEVMAILHEGAGIKHDPDLLHAFCSVIEVSKMRIGVKAEPV
ncbi:MAG: phosphohydrolase [Betaproteobacteria bacterium HGW-Betaproteobacteria-10]|nr:MAG: phosphohydrolase [Betaproteobacteria bacterium HGW-Betaproteobacteria-10]